MTRAVVLLVCALAATARADSAKLAAARRAVKDVRYDDARGLLVDALAAGGNAPDEVREIYQLSAAAAVVLGERELAEQYYRRVLALDPDARLPDDASPKLRQPFVAAQAYMAAHRRLTVRAVRRGRAIEVTVVGDPLGMVAAIAAKVGGAQRQKIAVTGAPVVLEPRGAVDELAVLDEHGNTLRTVAAPPTTGDAGGPDDRAADPGTPIVRRWVTWAIPAVVLGGVGAGFLIDGQRAKAELDDILANDGMHFLAEAEQQRTRWKDDTTIATPVTSSRSAMSRRLRPVAWGAMPRVFGRRPGTAGRVVRDDRAGR